MGKNRSVKLYLWEIIESLFAIQSYTKTVTVDDFLTKKMIQDAVVRRMEIIGEASKQIPEEIRNKYEDVDWSGMIGLRNVVIHDYFEVDYEDIWAIVNKEVDSTLSQFYKIAANELGFDDHALETFVDMIKTEFNKGL